MITFPNAKINLGLDILCRRPDGYHEISTVMIPTGWTDILEIVPGKGHTDTLTTTGRHVDCPPENNLAMKAVAAMRARHEFPAVELHLHKIIPDGAGLGGGSADASFTLRMLNSMFCLGETDTSLAAIAAEIGSDCPFFICNRPMLCSGTGTTLSPFSLELPEGLTLAIVKPQVSVPTRQAYAGVVPAVPRRSIASILADEPIEKWQGLLKNDFETSVFAAFPEIARIKSRLADEAALYASMSGSGSAVYAIFGSDIMADTLAEAFPGCAIFTGSLAAWK